MTNGYLGGSLVSSHCSTRASCFRSIVGGNAPVPNDALLLRSSMRLLLPSQWAWRFFCLRRPCSQIDGKSHRPTSSRVSSFSRGNSRIVLDVFNVLVRSGPGFGFYSCRRKWVLVIS